MQGLPGYVSRGAFWTTLYLALVLAPQLVLLVGVRPPPGGFWWDVAIALGFAGVSMMGVQFALTARFRRASAPFGIDLVYAFHRWAAVAALVLILAHPVILFVVDPVQLETLNPLVAPWYMTVGVWSVVALVVVVVSSLFRKPLRLPYELWRYLHAAFSALAVLFALLHVEGIGVHASSPWKRLTWGGLAAGWLALLAYVRVLKPWRSLRRPWKIAAVTRHPGRAWELALAPDGHPGVTFSPGQFAWLSLRAGPFAMKEHPFSFSSPPGLPGGRVEFTIKELGDFTRTLGTVQPGEVAYLDAPYGAFSIDRVKSPQGYVFLAGGIGIAPMLSMLRTLADRGDPRRHLLVYFYRDEGSLTGRDTIETLRARLELEVVYVLDAPSPSWAGERGLVSSELLRRYLGADPAARACLVCGPQPMIEATERALSELGVPVSRVHSELFDMV